MDEQLLTVLLIRVVPYEKWEGMDSVNLILEKSQENCTMEM